MTEAGAQNKYTKVDTGHQVQEACFKQRLQ